MKKFIFILIASFVLILAAVLIFAGAGFGSAAVTSGQTHIKPPLTADSGCWPPPVAPMR